MTFGGGPAALSILSGLASGVSERNKRKKEEEQERIRQALLDRQVQVAENQQRVAEETLQQRTREWETGRQDEQARLYQEDIQRRLDTEAALDAKIEKYEQGAALARTMAAQVIAKNPSLQGRDEEIAEVILGQILGMTPPSTMGMYDPEPRPQPQQTTANERLMSQVDMYMKQSQVQELLTSTSTAQQFIIGASQIGVPYSVAQHIADNYFGSGPGGAERGGGRSLPPTPLQAQQVPKGEEGSIPAGSGVPMHKRHPGLSGQAWTKEWDDRHWDSRGVLGRMEDEVEQEVEHYRQMVLSQGGEMEGWLETNMLTAFNQAMTPTFQLLMEDPESFWEKQDTPWGLSVLYRVQEELIKRARSAQNARAGTDAIRRMERSSGGGRAPR